MRGSLRRLLSTWPPLFPTLVDSLTQQLDAIDRTGSLRGVLAAGGSGGGGGSGVSNGAGRHQAAAFDLPASLQQLSSMMAHQQQAQFGAGGAPPVDSSASHAVAATPPPPPVNPESLVQELQAALMNARKSAAPAARRAAANLSSLVDVYSQQMAQAVLTARPVQAAGELYQRLQRHRAGATLELESLMPELVPGWKAPDIDVSAPPHSSSVSTRGPVVYPQHVAAVASKPPRGRNAPPPNMGMLRSANVWQPDRAMNSNSNSHSAVGSGSSNNDNSSRSSTGGNSRKRGGIDEATQRALQELRAKRQRASTAQQQQQQQIPIDFSPAFLKSESLGAIHAIYGAMLTQV